MQQAASTGDTKANSATPIDEVSGALGSDPEEKRLMRSVLENDKQTVNDGKLITAALNSGITAFTPDLLFEKIVTNYKASKKIHGESFLQEVSGSTEAEIERNKHIKEFQNELRKKIKNRLNELRKNDLIDKEGSMTQKAEKLSKLLMLTEELDKLSSKGLLGEKENKKIQAYGLREDSRMFRKDRYKDLDIRKTVKTAVRRGHSKIDRKDLRAFERKARGKRNIVYALDASGSMKGQKLIQSKKAGIALAYRATQEKDKVGVLVFGKEVKKKIRPTSDFKTILSSISSVTAKEKTNLAGTIRESISLFPKEDATKHLVLITDAMPTSGDEPEKDTIKAAGLAKESNITISIIGINLNREGQTIARKIVEISRGRIFVAKNLEEIDSIVIEDYYST